MRYFKLKKKKKIQWSLLIAEITVWCNLLQSHHNPIPKGNVPEIQRDTEMVMTQNIRRYYLPTRKIFSVEYLLFYNLYVDLQTKQICYLPHP